MRPNINCNTVTFGRYYNTKHEDKYCLTIQFGTLLKEYRNKKNTPINYNDTFVETIHLDLLFLSTYTFSNNDMIAVVVRILFCYKSKSSAK